MARASCISGDFVGTLKLYSSMRKAGIPANNYTYPFVLKASSSPTMAASFGKSIHGEILKMGFSINSHVQAALISNYGKSGEIEDARKLFDEMQERDLVTWTAMITAYEQASQAELSLLMFRQMQEEHGPVIDRVTAISVASAIAWLGDLHAAKSLHGHAVRRGFFYWDLSLENAILGMHAKCGDLGLARKLFDKMPNLDEISWNSMLSGYAQNGHCREAMSFFAKMLAVGPEPNSVTFLAATSACSQLGSLLLARHLHRLIIFSGDSESKEEVQNAIMDMYAKCGDLEATTSIFNRRLNSQYNYDINCFNVMISGYGLHGQGHEALQLFRWMTKEGLSPDHVTFTILLSACSHAGMVNEGKQIFVEMEDKYSMKPMAKHYAGLVDMLGRAGRLQEALELIAQMAGPPTDAIFGALLGGCRIHGNGEMAQLAAGEVFELDPEHSGYYVLASNVYAAMRKWPEARKVREVMRSKRVRKTAASSVVEIAGEMQGSYASERDSSTAILCPVNSRTTIEAKGL